MEYLKIGIQIGMLPFVCVFFYFHWAQHSALCISSFVHFRYTDSTTSLLLKKICILQLLDANDPLG